MSMGYKMSQLVYEPGRDEDDDAKVHKQFLGLLAVVALWHVDAFVRCVDASRAQVLMWGSCGCGV